MKRVYLMMPEKLRRFKSTSDVFEPNQQPFPDRLPATKQT